MYLGLRRRRAILGVTALTALLSTWPSASAAQQTGFTGTFHTVWVDPERGPPEAPLYFVSSAAGTVRLDISEAQLAAAGGPQALDRRLVSVAGALVVAAPGPAAVGATDPLLRVSSLTAGSSLVDAAPRLGSLPYVTILCRFPDVAELPGNRARYEAIMGMQSPGLDHYWRESSGNQIDLTGSVVTDWYVLPQPFSYYGNSYTMDLGRLVEDCTGVADADINFQQFAGVNLQFNARFPAAWGGSWHLALDGLNRLMPMTWLANWGGQAIYAHEMGHSFGLPHSSGPYGNVYDSPWDVMSSAYVRHVGGTYEWLGQHTISYHKRRLGWIGDRSRTVTEPFFEATLERGAQPAPGELLELRIPIPSTQKFYTVEARKRAGHDEGLPREGVVIHLVDPARAQPAHVQDGDANGTTDDDGSAWLPGETFTDPVNRIAVYVVQATPTGWDVIVRINPVTVTATVTGPGFVIASPTGILCPRDCTEGYAASETVTFTAEPSSGAVFVGWTGACSGTGECVISPQTQTAVGATFVQEAVVSVTVTGLGSVTSSPAGIDCPGDCEETVTAGSSITLTATPAENAVFSGWGGVCSGSSPTCQVSPNAGTKVTATFTVPQHTLSVDVTGPGTVTSVTGGIDCPAECEADYEAGAAVQLVATPEAGAVFEGWGGACEQASTCVVTLAGDALVHATFSAPLAITSTVVRPSGIMGAAYADQLEAVGGDGVYAWTLDAGTLPEGVTLSPSGALGGVAESEGEFTFTVRVASEGIEATRELTLLVTPPALVAEAVVDALLAPTPALTPDERRYLDLQGNRNGKLDAGDVRAWLQRRGLLTGSQ